MPRIVPSQVVEFIDTLRLTERDGNVRLNEVETFDLSSLLNLIEQIPDELLAMDATIYASFVHEKEHIKDIIENWRHDQALSRNRYSNMSPAEKSPLAIIRAALASCPDESSAPSTSEFNFIPDLDLRITLRNDLGYVNRALSNGEWKAATVLAGSIIEALLLWALQEHTPAAVSSAKSKLITSKKLQQPPPSDLEDWGLHQYIEVSEELAIIKSDTAKQTRLAKNFRNLIHPGRSRRLGQACDRATALSAVAGVEHVLRDLTP